MKEKHKNSKNAFTLVELLVVIAIISVLAGLLLPALEEAIESARQISCMNRMRNMYQFVEFYREDHDGWYPLDKVTAGGGVPPWTYASSFGGLVKPYTSSTETNTYASVSNNIFWCPDSNYEPGNHSAAVVRKDGYYAGSSHIGNYWTTAYFGLMCWGPPVEATTQFLPRKSLTKNISRLILLGEIRGASYYRFGQHNYTRYGIYPHSDQTNLVIADGHVESVYTTDGSRFSLADNDLTFYE